MNTIGITGTQSYEYHASNGKGSVTAGSSSWFSLYAEDSLGTADLKQGASLEAAQRETVRGTSIENMSICRAPYGFLADNNGIINYKGVIFVCDDFKKQLCLGDMSDENNVLTIPMSAGGTLKVNRDSLGALATVMDMFSPEDINRILRAIAQDAKAQQIKLRIDEDTNSIGEDDGSAGGSAAAGGTGGRVSRENDAEYAGSPVSAEQSNRYAAGSQEEKLFGNVPASVWEAWKMAEQDTGIEGYGTDGQGRLPHVSQIQLRLLTGQINGDYTEVFGPTWDSALQFARDAEAELDNYSASTGGEQQEMVNKEKEFYQRFIYHLNEGKP